MTVQISEHVIYVDMPPIVSAIPDSRRSKAAFPDAPLTPVPNPYDDDMHPDDFFHLRNACDGCDDGIDYGEDMVATRRFDGTIETLCPTCFCTKYGTYYWSTVNPYMHVELLYVNVRQGGRYYRWERES